jgi:hypothetical protein
VADVTIGTIAGGQATAVADADKFELEQGGVSKWGAFSQLEDYIGMSVRNQSTADQAPAAATLTYLTGSNLTVPAGKLRIGTVFRWSLVMTKTAAGTAARTFHVRVGTAGTTADTAVLTFTTGIGTAAIDAGCVDIIVTCRGPLSASGIFQGSFSLYHNLATTGFLTKGQDLLAVTSSAFNVTTAGLIVGLSFTSGASELVTFKQIVSQALNL